MKENEQNMKNKKQSVSVFVINKKTNQVVHLNKYDDSISNADYASKRLGISSVDIEVLENRNAYNDMLSDIKAKENQLIEKNLSKLMKDKKNTLLKVFTADQVKVLEGVL